MHSVLAQATAWRRISEPRAPGPMIPMRMRSLAPRSLEAASEQARLVATLPMKWRRDCMGRILLLVRLTDKTIIAKGWGAGRERALPGVPVVRAGRPWPRLRGCETKPIPIFGQCRGWLGRLRARAARARDYGGPG